jgi:hypothetical protein
MTWLLCTTGAQADAPAGPQPDPAAPERGFRSTSTVHRDLVGVWEGAILTPGGPIWFTLRLETDRGALSIPQQGIADAPIHPISGDAQTLDFEFGEPGSASSFHVSRFPGTDSASGTMTQAGASFPCTLKRTPAPPPLLRPQTPAPPFPYDEEPFELNHGDIHLEGTLTLPSGAGRHPAVLLLGDGGRTDRDGSYAGHRPLAVLADHLTRAGFAVLRTDDRGAGGSTTPHPESTTTLDVADDARATIAWLRRHDRVRADRVGIIGHSEGAVVAALTASRSPAVSFIVLLAGSAVRGDALMEAQAVRSLRAAGIPDADVEEAALGTRRILDAVIEGETEAELVERIHAMFGDGPNTRDAARAQAAGLATPWMRTFLTLDPSRALRATRCPTLALFASDDMLVPSEQNLPAMVAALRKNPDATVRAIEGLTHALQPSPAGEPFDPAAVNVTIDPRVLTEVTAWLLPRAGLRPPAPAAP